MLCIPYCYCRTRDVNEVNRKESIKGIVNFLKLCPCMMFFISIAGILFIVLSYFCKTLPDEC